MRKKSLTSSEEKHFQRALDEVSQNAKDHRHIRPQATVLIEEFSEAILSLRGKHKDPVVLELTQIAGVCINLIWQLEAGYEEHVNNIIAEKDKQNLGKKSKKH